MAGSNKAIKLHRSFQDLWHHQRAFQDRLEPVQLTKLLDIDAACARHPAAERQLRALRAVATLVAYETSSYRPHVEPGQDDACDLLAELDAADAAAKGGGV